MAITSRHKGHSFNLTAHSGQVTWCQHGWKTISLAPSRHTTHFRSRSIDGTWSVFLSDREGRFVVSSVIGILVNKNGSSEQLAVGCAVWGWFSVDLAEEVEPRFRSSFISSSSTSEGIGAVAVGSLSSTNVASGADGILCGFRSSKTGSRIFNGLFRCSFSDQMAAIGWSESVSMLRRPIDRRIRSRVGRASCADSLPCRLWVDNELTERNKPIRFLARFCSISRNERRLEKNFHKKKVQLPA